MIWNASNIDGNRLNPRDFLAVSIGMHLALIFWNPVVFRNVLRIIEGPVIEVWDAPGLETPQISGERTGRRGPLLPTPVSDLAVQPPATVPSSRPAPDVKPASALVSKTFSPIGFAGVPAAIDPDVQAITLPSRIQIEKREASLAKSAGHPLLEERRAGRFSMHDARPISMAEGDGVMGRILIRPAPVATAKEETIRNASAHEKARLSDPSIEGPLSNRAVLHRVIPPYPAWAEEQGIMGTVRLFFTVNASGEIQNSIRVRQTSGNAELDRLALEALQQWRFSPSRAENGQQWGIITFTFTFGRD